MLDLRKLYGKVTIEGEDFEYNQHPKQQEKIFLEYYKTKKAQTKNEKKYGIEVIKKEENKLHLKNAYRVLLTRARQGMVIFVPQGSDEDKTRKREWYDNIFNFLCEVGIEVL